MFPGGADLMRLLGGQRVSKPPFWEVWFWMHDFCRRRYGDYQKVENRIALAQDLGMAAVLLGDIITNVWFMDNRMARDGTSHYAGGALTDLGQFDDRPLPDWTEAIAQWKRDQQAIQRAGLVSWMILPWCFHAVSISMGLENFALKLYDDFEFVDRAFEIVEERNQQAIDQVVAEVRPDIVLIDGDCAYKNALMVRPDLFRTLTFSKTSETVGRLRKLGIPYTFHTDGKLDDVLPLLVELGFSAVHGCEKAANDLDHLVERFGDDIVLMGNMDVVFLTHSGPAEVGRETEAMLEQGNKRGKFVAACNTSPMDYIPDENYLAMADAIRQFAGRRS